MKELSIEEKVKAYDKALERAKGAHNGAKSDKENGVTDKITEYTIQLTETIFPELKESDDERIRKMLIDSFTRADMGGEIYGKGVTYKQVIAWLERQGEKDKLIKEPGEYKVKYAQEILSQQLEKQGEQNPAWSDEDEKMYTATIFALAGFMGNEDKLDWLKSLKDRVQPKQEWSEEDEKHYQGCLNLMKLSLDTKPYPYYNDYLWLKSLRPQSTWKPSN